MSKNADTTKLWSISLVHPANVKARSACSRNLQRLESNRKTRMPRKKANASEPVTYIKHGDHVFWEPSVGQSRRAKRMFSKCNHSNLFLFQRDGFFPANRKRVSACSPNTVSKGLLHKKVTGKFCSICSVCSMAVSKRTWLKKVAGKFCSVCSMAVSRWSFLKKVAGK